MSSISVAYKKPKTTNYVEDIFLDDSGKVINNLAKNVFPLNLDRILEVSESYRDLLICSALDPKLTVEQMLNILGTLCRYVSDIYRIKKMSDIRICEIIITISYIFQGKFGDQGNEFQKLMEDTFLRVPYDRATPYIKAVYDAVIAEQVISPAELEEIFLNNQGEIYNRYLKEDKVY